MLDQYMDNYGLSLTDYSLTAYRLAQLDLSNHYVVQVLNQELAVKY